MRDSETEPTERDRQGSDRLDSNEADTKHTDQVDASGVDGSTTPGTDADSPTDDDRDAPVPTRQPSALRRQQIIVGGAGAVLVAIAVIVSLFQQFPTLPFPVILLAGLFGGIGMAWLVLHSVFPGEGEPPEE